jgi:putative transposase
MASPRLFVPGLSHHVRHRGNNGCDVFLDSQDRTTFLEMLDKSARSRGVRVHGYVLMTTHFHAQVTSPAEDALPRMMQRLGRSYVRYFNQRHRRTGTLWEGRYRASLIQTEQYWFNCLRYIERNPVRPGMVVCPSDYPWSSYRSNALGLADALLEPHTLYLRLGANAAARARAWAQICGQPVSERELAQIRSALQKGLTLGSDEQEEPDSDVFPSPAMGA